MDEKMKRAAESRRKYDAENMAILATKMKKEEVQAFRTLAEQEGTTVSQKLSGFIRGELAEHGKVETYVPAVLTAKNADRLKHETAFHNPKGLNPDQLMNDILDQYFAFVYAVRQGDRCEGAYEKRELAKGKKR